MHFKQLVLPDTLQASSIIFQACLQPSASRRQSSFKDVQSVVWEVDLFRHSPTAWITETAIWQHGSYLLQTQVINDQDQNYENGNVIKSLKKLEWILTSPLGIDLFIFYKVLKQNICICPLFYFCLFISRFIIYCYDYCSIETVLKNAPK